MTDTPDLNALSEAATQGEWIAERASGLSIYMRHEDGIRGRHIADTGRISSDAPRHVVEQDKANAAYIAALVNAHQRQRLCQLRHGQRSISC